MNEPVIPSEPTDELSASPSDRTPMTAGSIEALILTAAEPISAARLAQIVPDVSLSGVREIVTRLNTRYTEQGGSFRIREIAGGYQIAVLPEFVGVIDEMQARRRKVRLSRAALETMAIVAYKQPVTRAEIEAIRGVAADAAVTSLLEKNLIEIVGRATTPGKALQYGTATEFLKFFGLKSLDDLPQMAEIEEMLAAADQSRQAQLTLDETMLQPDTGAAARLAKLNIADGTYSPADDLADEASRPEGARVLRIVRAEEASPADLAVTDEPMTEEESLT